MLVRAPYRRVLASLLGEPPLGLLALRLLLAQLLGLMVVHVSLAYACMTRFHAHYDEWTERRIGTATPEPGVTVAGLSYR